MSRVYYNEAEKLVADHERIWLQNAADGEASGEGRMWCQDKVWPVDENDGEPTEYVRADLYADALATTAEMAEREEAALAGLTSDIAREIEAHDAFDCPDGWTYVRAANEIAQRLVDRFGRVQALSRSSTESKDA